MVRALFPGTFDPIHFGHIDIANRASRLFDEVLVAVYDKSPKNLVFSPEERLQMVKFSLQDNPKIVIVPFSGLLVEFCQKKQADVIVRGLRVFSDFEYEFRMAIANRRLAPEIETMALITSQEHTFLSSTTVREIASLNGDVSTMVPPHVEVALVNKFKTFSERRKDSHMNSLRD